MARLAINLLRLVALGRQAHRAGLLTVNHPPHHAAKHSRILRRRQLAVLMLIRKTLHQKRLATCLHHRVVKHRFQLYKRRWVILRGVLAEAILISLAGGAAGTLLASALLRALSRWQPFVELPFHVIVLPDAKVYIVALLLAVGSGIFFGMLPARQIRRSDAAQLIKSSVGTEMLFRRLALREVLLFAQIALCTLLVTASLVALRGMELQRRNHVRDRVVEGYLSFQVGLPVARQDRKVAFPPALVQAFTLRVGSVITVVRTVLATLRRTASHRPVWDCAVA